MDFHDLAKLRTAFEERAAALKAMAQDAGALAPSSELHAKRPSLVVDEARFAKAAGFVFSEHAELLGRLAA